jgi:hypothetical protein
MTSFDDKWTVPLFWVSGMPVSAAQAESVSQLKLENIA